MGSSIRVLGTGGTIAGVSPQGASDARYTAGQLAVRELLAPLLPLDGGRVERVEPLEVAQIDSCNMAHAVWLGLVREIRRAQDDPEVVGVVVTHGTDTLEETAVFVDRVVGCRKPVVFTAAMRPASSPQADGPENLRRALALAADPHAAGLLMAFGGQVWPAVSVRKVDPFSLQAFHSGDQPPLAIWKDGCWRWDREALAALRDAPRRPTVAVPDDVARWPVVEIVASHAGCTGLAIRSLLDAGVQGLVISGTGNGSIHESLDAALREAVDRGRLRLEQVRVASRCTAGWVVGTPSHGWPTAARQTPAQARVDLMLDLMSEPQAVR